MIGRLPCPTDVLLNHQGADNCYPLIVCWREGLAASLQGFESGVISAMSVK